MEKIGAKLKIERRVSTYVARHTFSTVMKRSGVSTEFIQEAFGGILIFGQQKIILTVLKKKERKKEYAARLLAF
ncbi:MAG TPA: hypothetical protein VIM07_09555 [Chitinophagaceae bacterium]